MTNEQTSQLNDIILELVCKLDITDTEFETLTQSYKAVGSFLSEESSPLHAYSPEIRPQGSFLLGTVVRPVSDDADIDIDLVCELHDKPADWAQYDLKQAVGDRLKENKLYKGRLDKEGKRCWTIIYGDGQYHMDVLPSLMDKGYGVMLERSFSNDTLDDVKALAFRLTDNTKKPDYFVEKNSLYWPISNPFGYAKWFLHNASRYRRAIKMFSLNEDVQPVPKYDENRYPLQRIVQLLKRHRDIMFADDDDNKPISIIITTLATHAYNDETGLMAGFKNVARNMVSHIEKRGDEYWIPNPVNKYENFADKWKLYPVRKDNFFRWVDKLQKDINTLESCAGRGLNAVQAQLEAMFGEKVSKLALKSFGENQRLLRESGKLKVTAGTATLGLAGSGTVAAHNFFGGEESDV